MKKLGLRKIHRYSDGSKAMAVKPSSRPDINILNTQDDSLRRRNV